MLAALFVVAAAFLISAGPLAYYYKSFRRRGFTKSFALGLVLCQGTVFALLCCYLLSDTIRELSALLHG